MKALLLEVGGLRISSPRQVLKEAFSLGWINEEQKWLDLLEARNLTSEEVRLAQLIRIWIAYRELKYESMAQLFDQDESFCLNTQPCMNPGQVYPWSKVRRLPIYS